LRLSIHSRLQYEVRSATTFIFAVQVASAPGDAVLSETLSLPPGVNADFFVEPQGPNRLVRFLAQPGLIEVDYRAMVEKTSLPPQATDLSAVSISDLPPQVLPYLLPSRYCQSDRLTDMAQRQFGHLPAGLAQAQAITDWIAGELTYQSGASDGCTSAVDTLQTRAGVCRDFAHLGVALCRALDMPARLASGYAWKLQPPDFHAVFQVYLGGSWITFDATRLAPLEGFVQIATGRDAADVPFASFFGNAIMVAMRVEVSEAALTPEPA
jgi:transglutaminase-like putative cysteine protease